MKNQKSFYCPAFIAFSLFPLFFLLFVTWPVQIPTFRVSRTVNSMWTEQTWIACRLPWFAHCFSVVQCLFLVVLILAQWDKKNKINSTDKLQFCNNTVSIIIITVFFLCTSVLFTHQQTIFITLYKIILTWYIQKWKLLNQITNLKLAPARVYWMPFEQQSFQCIVTKVLMMQIITKS